MSCRQKIYEIVSNILECPIDNINENSSPDTLESWDSLHHMRLIIALEDEFDIAFHSEEITSLLSVREIIIAVEKSVEQ